MASAVLQKKRVSGKKDLADCAREDLIAQHSNCPGCGAKLDERRICLKGRAYSVECGQLNCDIRLGYDPSKRLWEEPWG